MSVRLWISPVSQPTRRDTEKASLSFSLALFRRYRSWSYRLWWDWTLQFPSDNSVGTKFFLSHSVSLLSLLSFLTDTHKKKEPRKLLTRKDAREKLLNE